MHIRVGSMNPVKLAAVRQAILPYDFFKGAIVIGKSIASAVSNQPLGFDEIYRGARTRAESAFDNSPAYSIGLEGGLCKIPGELTHRLNLTICVLSDGKQTYAGTSSGFLIPAHVAETIERENIQLDEALYREGLTKEKRVGYGKGIIGVFTQGSVTRQDLLEEAIRNALIPLINKESFRLP